MRTTLTLEPEIAERLQQEAARGGRSFKAVVNEALRRGLGFDPPARTKPYRVTAHSSRFQPGLDHGKLNQLVDEIEVGEFRHHRPGKPRRPR